MPCKRLYIHDHYIKHLPISSSPRRAPRYYTDLVRFNIRRLQFFSYLMTSYTSCSSGFYGRAPPPTLQPPNTNLFQRRSFFANFFVRNDSFDPITSLKLHQSSTRFRFFFRTWPVSSTSFKFYGRPPPTPFTKKYFVVFFWNNSLDP